MRKDRRKSILTSCVLKFSVLENDLSDPITADLNLEQLFVSIKPVEKDILSIKPEKKGKDRN